MKKVAEDRITIRVFRKDKDIFRKISFELRMENERITEAILFKEMVDWLKKNKEFVAKKYSIARG